MFPPDDLIGWLIKGLLATLTFIVGLMGWMFKTEKKKIDDYGKEIADLRMHSVSEDKVREIVTESLNTAINPVHSSMEEIKQLVRRNTECTEKLQIKLAEMEGYQKAQRDQMKVVSNGH